MVSASPVGYWFGATLLDTVEGLQARKSRSGGDSQADTTESPLCSSMTSLLLSLCSVLFLFLLRTWFLCVLIVLSRRNDEGDIWVFGLF